MKPALPKRIMAWLLALVLSAGMSPRALAAGALESYLDLDAGAWYASGVRYCLKHDLMSGYGKRMKYFEPETAVTRAQIATVLWRMEGAPVVGLTMQYADVPEDMWYTEAVRWAASADVMSGYTALAFGPDDPVSREQLATILWRYARLRNEWVPSVPDPLYESYADRDTVSGYAAEAMEWACALGIVSGFRDRNGDVWLLPAAQSSRAVLATILMRFCLDMGIYE